ncbi:hypothetical protein [uncultured Mucilaginibacter sp.]|uniref:hypothetical protein n=1 Tax=uncultured Mucilaginibacter sp. TaxID=797541 RepID=UPI00261C9095|nr:hypothetical protein [uncultured Mucilaginibacter sp.]
METSEIKKKLHDYIEFVAEEKLKAIYIVLESDIESVYNHQNDPRFVAETESRTKKPEAGTEKENTWQEAKAKAMKRIVEG